MHAGKLQLGEFLDLHWRLGFRGRLAGFGATGLVGGGGAGKFRANRIPDFVGIDLRFAQAEKIVGDGFFVVEAEMLGVGPNESFIEDAAGKLIEVFLFDGLEHAGADLGNVGDVIEREIFFLARLAEFVSELAHGLVEGGSGNNDRTSGARLPQPRVLERGNQWRGPVVFVEKFLPR